jgi:hypothetical protein
MGQEKILTVLIAEFVRSPDTASAFSPVNSVREAVTPCQISNLARDVLVTQ